jgi:hypothetical protein
MTVTAELRLLIDLVIVPVLLERLCRDCETASESPTLAIVERRGAEEVSGVGSPSEVESTPPSYPV